MLANEQGQSTGLSLILLVGTGLLANAQCQSTGSSLIHRIRQQAGSYNELRQPDIPTSTFKATSSPPGIAAWLDNEPLPLPRSVAEACHPSRFAVRHLIRGK